MRSLPTDDDKELAAWLEAEANDYHRQKRRDRFVIAATLLLFDGLIIGFIAAVLGMY